MPSLRERNRHRTRREIEAVALELFETQGYEATTVEQIAQGAAVSSATFFRYYGSKEEVLFANERSAVDEMVKLVAQREDRSISVIALAEPIATYARTFLGETTSDAQRLTRLVMTTRALEARSMRMRLRWEHGIARQLARERGSDSDSTTFDDVLTAGLAVSCLSAALWNWQKPDTPDSIFDTTLRAFERSAELNRLD